MIRENYSVDLNSADEITEIVQNIVNQRHFIEVIEVRNALAQHDHSDNSETLERCFYVRIGEFADSTLIETSESFDADFSDGFVCDTLIEALEVHTNAVASFLAA